MRLPQTLRQICTSAFLLLALAPCVHADTAYQEFAAARQRWQTAGPRDYSFLLLQRCFCPRAPATRITVQNGVVQSARNITDDTPVEPARLGGLPSLDGILQKIEEAYAQPADEISLTLNPTYGYPEHVFIDYYKRMADEELVYEIRDFTH